MAVKISFLGRHFGQAKDGDTNALVKVKSPNRLRIDAVRNQRRWEWFYVYGETSCRVQLFFFIT
jgi:hypothetical protein